MDLSRPLSAAPGGTTTRPAGTGTSETSGGTAGATPANGDEGFVAALKELLEPLSEPVDEATLARLEELAGEHADGELGDDDAVAVWPLALLLAAAGSPASTGGGAGTAEGDGEAALAEGDGEVAPAEAGESDPELGGADAEAADLTGQLEDAEVPTDGELEGGEQPTDGEVEPDVEQPEPPGAAPPSDDAEADDRGGPGASDPDDPDGAPPTRPPQAARDAAAPAADTMATTPDDAASAGSPDAGTRLGDAAGNATRPASTGDADGAQQRAATSAAAPTVDAADDADPLPTAQRSSTRVDAPSPSSSTTEQVRAGDLPPPPGTTSTSTDASHRAATMGDGVRRVLEAIELLENAPPPRQLTIEVGESRVRVSLEDGGVRLTALQGAADDVDELLRAAEDALTEQGFDLGGDRGSDDQPDDGDSPGSAHQPVRDTRTVARGLRL